MTKIKKMIGSTICLKNIFIWMMISLGCLIALGTSIRNLLELIAKGEEIFLPGIAAFFAVVILFSAYSVTRVVKHVKLLKEIQREARS